MPPIVVYKAQCLFKNWTLGWPSGTEYNATKSGWFDSRTFETLFVKVCLQNILASRNYPIFVIGDDLLSHFSKYVVEECIKTTSFLCDATKLEAFASNCGCSCFRPTQAILL